MNLSALATPLDLADELSSVFPWRLRLGTQRWVAAVRSIRAALRPRTIWRLTGPARSDGGSLEVATDLGGDALAYWSRLLFAAEPTRAALGCHRVAARLGLARDADVALLGHHRAFRGRARRLGYVTAPAWLETGIVLGRSVDETLARARYGARSRASDLRRIRRAALGAAVVRDAEEIRTFLRDWYEPYVRARWGRSYVGLDADSVRRAPRFCELLWVLAGGERVAGLLIESQGDTLRMLVLGMRDAERRRDGALAAVYYFAIAEAVRRGQRLLRTGGARPVLSDGVLDFKRKWGAAIRPGSQLDYLAIGVRAWSPTLRALFARHPVVVETERDGFLAIGEPGETRVQEVDGLRGVVWPASGGGWRIAPVGSAGSAVDLVSA